MAELKKPTRTTKGIPPKELEVPNNLQKTASSELKALNFKVDPDFHKSFKSLTIEKGFPTMVDMLKDMYEKYTKY